MNKPLEKIDFSKIELSPDTRSLLEELLNRIERLESESRKLREENQNLRDEVARLKKRKGKPVIKANQPDSEDEKKKLKSRKKRHRHKPRRERIKIDREETVKLDRKELPEDVQHRGYRDVVIQNIRFETDNVRYRLERVYSPSTGKFYEAILSSDRTGQSYGSDIEAFIIMLYFELRVTQNKIHKLLKSIGIVISAGQVSNILIRKHKKKFSKERKKILEAGLKTTQYHHTDDTGARENGINHHTFSISNFYYSSFFTTRYKNKETVKELLSLLNNPKEKETSEKKLGDFIPILVCDDAPQFHEVTQHRGLCWVHEVRHFEKLHPFFEHHQKIVDSFIAKLWKYYARLKRYKESPSEKMKEALSVEFDELLSPSTGYDELDHRITLTRKKKENLLLVLDFPEVPLHNNLAERDLREFVIKRKISNGTRVEEGTKAWDIFLSVLGTCRKNDVNFYAYLRDRISLSFEMPSLASTLTLNAA